MSYNVLPTRLKDMATKCNLNFFTRDKHSCKEEIHIKMLSIATNWTCNVRCEICDIWKKTTTTLLSPFELESSIESPFFNEVVCVGFFGGEPTLHPELPRLMEIIKNRFGINASIVTNGYGNHIPMVLKSLIEFNPLICVSIDGKGAIHDKRRGRKGVYDDAVRTLGLARDLFSQRPRISFTVLPDTVNEIPHIFRLANEFDADISMRIGTSGSYFGGIADENWNVNTIYQLENHLIKIPDKFWANPSFIKEIPDFLRTGKNRRQCKAAYLILVVDPNLDTRICHTLDPICSLANVPDKWGIDEKWKIAKNGKCFKRECFIDGPYSVEC